MSANKEAQLIAKLQRILRSQNNLKIEGNKLTINGNSISIPQNTSNRTATKQIDVGI